MADSGPDAEQWIPAGTALGKYAIVDRIGVGGLAEVYEAVHLALKKRVALKVLRQDVAQHAEIVQRFTREGKHASLIKHPNVVDVYDVGEFQGVPFLVMEFLEGAPLDSMLPAGRVMTFDAVADLMLPIIAGVRAIHQHDVVHRDLKPANIFVERSGGRITPKILDFGVSRCLTEQSRLTKPGVAIGTPHYMAPEQARGEMNASFAADQYSLGVILYEMLTGCVPRQNASGAKLLHAVAYEPFDSPRLWRPDLPAPLEQLVLTAMAADPAHRYPSLGKMAVALVPYASQRVQTSWAAEFDETATSPEATVRVVGRGMPAQTLVRGPALSLWDDDDDQRVTDLSELLPQLPSELQEVMARWSEVRADRTTPTRERAMELARQVRKLGDHEARRAAAAEPIPESPLTSPSAVTAAGALPPQTAPAHTAQWMWAFGSILLLLVVMAIWVALR